MAENEGAEQNAAMAMEYYQRQLDAYTRQIEFLQGVLDETARARRSLEGLAEEKSAEILVPIGALTYVPGSVADKDRVITGIGAGYAIEMSREQAVKRLSGRESEIQSELDRMMQAAIQLQNEAAAIQERLEGPSEQ